MKVCLDTNVFIAVKNREPGSDKCERILDSIEAGKHVGVVSTIVLGEVMVGFFLLGEKMEASLFLSKVVQDYVVSPVNVEISRLAAEIRAESGLRFPDAIVVATARENDCELLLTKDKEVLKVARGLGIDSKTPGGFAP